MLTTRRWVYFEIIVDVRWPVNHGLKSLQAGGRFIFCYIWIWNTFRWFFARYLVCNKNRGAVETALKKSRLLTMSNSEQCEIQGRRCKGRLTSSHSRLCAYNSELRWKLKPPSALGYLITPNFRTRRVFPLRVLASCLPQQILNFPSNLFTHFDEKALEFTWIA